MSQCFADDLGDGDSFDSGPTCEAFFEFWIESDEFDRRGL